MYRQEPFAQLLWQHLLLVGVSGAASVLLGALVGVWVRRTKGRSFRPVVEALVSMGQTLPPVAVLALALVSCPHCWRWRCNACCLCFRQRSRACKPFLRR